MIKVFIVYQLGHRKIHKSAQHVFWSFFFPCLFFFLFSFCFFFSSCWPARRRLRPVSFFRFPFLFVFPWNLFVALPFSCLVSPRLGPMGGRAGARARRLFLLHQTPVWYGNELKRKCRCVCFFVRVCVCVFCGGGGMGFVLFLFFYEERFQMW